MKSPCHIQFIVLGLLCFVLCATSLRGNVYATDIRLDGSINTKIFLPGGSVIISYILNDTATGGVWVRIYCGTNVVKTFASAAGEAGTNAGLNSLTWDGATVDATNLAEGAYTVSITAASAGYCAWTNITDDGTNFFVQVPRGIGVNRNTNSPFYGRVFVGNTYTRFGISKYNADGSPGDEGGFSTGGLTWGSGTGFPKYSPWKIAISEDDKVYIDDFSGPGVLYEFDQTVATNNYAIAINSDNYPNSDPDPELSGLAITGAGTNTQIWMTEGDPANSEGIIVWQAATNGIAAAADTGTVAVPVEPDFLSQAPYDLAFGPDGFIYTIQFIKPNADPAYDLMCFPPYAGQAEGMVDWAIESYPALLEEEGIGVDPARALVAVAVVGSGGDDSETDTTGGLYLYNATNGNFLVNLDQTGGDAYYDVAWDRVGNLYALDGTAQVWRAYSPPGTNQATTVAVPFIQAYNALLPPRLCGPVASPVGLRLTLEGQSNITYIVQRSCDLTNWTAVATNFSPSTNRCICLPVCGSRDFYRAVTSP